MLILCETSHFLQKFTAITNIYHSWATRNHGTGYLFYRAKTGLGIMALFYWIMKKNNQVIP
jgi:hypothetical protein